MHLCYGSQPLFIVTKMAAPNPAHVLTLVLLLVSMGLRTRLPIVESEVGYSSVSPTLVPTPTENITTLHLCQVDTTGLQPVPFSFTYGRLYRKPFAPHINCIKLVRAHVLLLYLTLLKAGDIQPNPGPAKRKYTPRFPCGSCSKACKWGTNCIMCEGCDSWFHKACIGMNTAVFNVHANDSNLPWECYQCGLPNFGSSLFETLPSST